MNIIHVSIRIDTQIYMNLYIYKCICTCICIHTLVTHVLIRALTTLCRYWQLYCSLFPSSFFSKNLRVRSVAFFFYFSNKNDCLSFPLLIAPLQQSRGSRRMIYETIRETINSSKMNCRMQFVYVCIEYEILS